LQILFNARPRDYVCINMFIGSAKKHTNFRILAAHVWQLIHVKQDAQTFFKFTLRTSAYSASSRARLVTRIADRKFDRVVRAVVAYLRVRRKNFVARDARWRRVRPRKLRGKLDSAVERQKRDGNYPIRDIRLPGYRSGNRNRVSKRS